MSETNERVIWSVELRMEKRVVRGDRPKTLRKELYRSRYQPNFGTEEEARVAFDAADNALANINGAPS